MTIRAIIADDEQPLRSSLRKHLALLWPELVISGEAENGHQALELIIRETPDIAFLDIRMPGMSGLEVAGQIAGSCAVVFVTAYEQHAVEAFEDAAIDYLLKPITDDRLNKTVNRLKKHLSSSSEPKDKITASITDIINKLENEKNKFLQWIRAQHGDTIRLVPVADIYYFQASDKYTVVITANQEFLIRTPIKELARKLNPEHFWQIHRKTIVNANRIEKLSKSFSGRYLINLNGREEQLTVSRSYTHLFKQM